MMAPVSSWTNGKLPPRRMFIDLTRDSEDEDDEDVADQAKALLDAFTRPRVGESRSRKRKSPADDAEAREPRAVPAVNHEIFSRQAPAPAPPLTSAVSHAAENNVSISVNSPKQRTGPAAPGTPFKLESRRPTPKPAPPSSASFQSHVISSNPSTRSNSEKPTLMAKTTPRPSSSLQSQANSSKNSSRSNSEKPTSLANMVKRRSTPRHSRSPSVVTATPRTSQVMVVVPPPRSPHISKKKINRLPSACPESEENSDPDEPKGVKQKYYPIEMYELQAEMGRYPAARSTNSNLIVVPTRPAPPYGSANRGHPKPPHSRKLHLRELLEKKLRKIRGPPVAMAHDWDGMGSVASNFEFINTYKLQKGVTRADEGFNYGCDCGPQCDPNRCTCLSKEEDSEGLMVAYEHRNGKLLLKDDFIKRKAMIYECSSLCPCRPSCWNRLVQHGRKIRLEIFHTGNRGFGLRSLDFIHRGQFIDTYRGEVITSAEAELREDATASGNGSHSSPSYLFSLDWFPSSSEDDDEEDGTHYVVDGQRFGGPSRFMNHSCNPNCKMVPVSTHHGDQKIYDLAFFARRDIPPGVELTFDYNPGWSPEMNSDDPNAVKCLCGEAQCRGQLWPNQRKSTNV